MPTRKEAIVTNPLERFRKVFTEISAPKGGLPTMPTKIVEKSTDELGNLISCYSAWREFTEDRHMEACAVYAQIKAEYDLECAKEMLRSDDKQVATKKARAITSDTMVELSKKLEESEIYRDLLSRKLDSFTNTLVMLSRELTRRGVYKLD